MKECFVSEELVDFTIDGMKFSYKPITAGEENDWLEDYIDTIPVKKENGDTVLMRKENLGKLNECKLRLIKMVPWEKEELQKITGVNKEWEELDKEQRILVFKKLKPFIFSQIIKEIRKIDNPEEPKN